MTKSKDTCNELLVLYEKEKALEGRQAQCSQEIGDLKNIVGVDDYMSIVKKSRELHEEIANIDMVFPLIGRERIRLLKAELGEHIIGKRYCLKDIALEADSPRLPVNDRGLLKRIIDEIQNHKKKNWFDFDAIHLDIDGDGEICRIDSVPYQLNEKLLGGNE